MTALEAPLLYVGIALAGYLLGSIPFGLLLTQAAGGGDIRAIGSGNIGATNVLRTGRKGLALATLLLDAAKGALPILAARLWLDDPLAEALAGGGAFIGHLFPVWLGFKGGKGVATFYGVLLALSWPVGLIAAAVWIGMAAAFRLSSLAALTASVVAPVAMALLGAPLETIGLTLIMAALIWLRHQANIARLLRGDEPRIGQKAPVSSDPDA